MLNVLVPLALLLVAGFGVCGPIANNTFDGAALSRRASSKHVVAHVIVGNTFPYTQTNWLSDIKLAHENGIDGFALNVGPDSWQPERVADA